MHVFTYGSLMFPAIWQRVVRGAYRSEPAVLSGHARYSLIDDSYPGIVENPQATVDGILYIDVDEADVVALDAFEGSEYRRTMVAVQQESGETAMVAAYLFTAVHRLSGQAWEPEAFRTTRFIASYCGEKTDA